MRMKAAKLNTVTRQWLGASALALAFVAPVYAAPVPVVESQPVGNNSSTQAAVSAKETADNKNVDTESENGSSNSDVTGTAYLLNTIEQMRQEIMELHGRLEEHQFQINQLRQESRDRYLDLDERIARQNGNGKLSVRTPVPAPDATITGTSRLDNAVASDEADGRSNDAVQQAAEQKSYQAAFQLIRSKEFDEAQVALKKQLEAYPKGDYADNARYWLGEVQMAQSQYPEARDTFELLLKDYPDSTKVADATYKLGRVYDLLGDKSKAKKLLQDVVREHPDTAAARLSDTYLRSMPDS